MNFPKTLHKFNKYWSEIWQILIHFFVRTTIAERYCISVPKVENQDRKSNMSKWESSTNLLKVVGQIFFSYFNSDYCNREERSQCWPSWAQLHHNRGNWGFHYDTARTKGTCKQKSVWWSIENQALAIGKMDIGIRRSRNLLKSGLWYRLSKVKI